MELWRTQLVTSCNSSPSEVVPAPRFATVSSRLGPATGCGSNAKALRKDAQGEINWNPCELWAVAPRPWRVAGPIYRTSKLILSWAQILYRNLNLLWDEDRNWTEHFNCKKYKHALAVRHIVSLQYSRLPTYLSIGPPVLLDCVPWLSNICSVQSFHSDYLSKLQARSSFFFQTFLGVFDPIVESHDCIYTVWCFMFLLPFTSIRSYFVLSIQRTFFIWSI